LKCAARWLRDNSTSLNIDPDRIGALGLSAGGHLSLLHALSNRGTMEGTGGHAAFSSVLQAVVSWYGPTDMIALYQATSPTNRLAFEAMFGGSPTTVRQHYLDASPITYVGAGDPPILLVHGTADGTVPYAQSTALNNAAKAAGNTSTLIPEQNAPHNFRAAYEEHATAESFSFFSTHLKGCK
jgi:dipeptidyl aminopeptidase/acylaminoacyl peptidase